MKRMPKIQDPSRRHRDIIVALALSLSAAAATGCGSDSSNADADPCPSPKVWRYEQPGCGADAPPPICGNAGGDACLAFVCGCNGEVLSGCDYFERPWLSRGICPGACYSPTQNLDLPYLMSMLAGCACDPAVDRDQCVSVHGSPHPIACVQGLWGLDLGSSCNALDAGASDAGPADAPARVD